MEKFGALKTYATFGLTRSLRQMIHAMQSRSKTEQEIHSMLNLLHRDENRIVHELGKPLDGIRLLEIGPGQRMERALYFGRKNHVTAIDLDVIPIGLDVRNYLQMLKRNSIGRLVKTFGRKALLVDHRIHLALKKAMKTDEFNYPQVVHADICAKVPDIGRFDVAVSWAVFEHLADPRSALDNIIRLIRPGGVFYICISLFTCNTGHHDIRAFTGMNDRLPLWGHLRPSTRHLIHPSAFLNEWRLWQWRELFSEMAPGFLEFLETYSEEKHYGPLMTDELRYELRDYTDEELFTVDAIYLWRKLE